MPAHGGRVGRVWKYPCAIACQCAIQRGFSLHEDNLSSYLNLLPLLSVVTKLFPFTRFGQNLAQAGDRYRHGHGYRGRSRFPLLQYLYYSRYREGELRTAQLSAQLAQAQLQALRAQLHPHFLFNTLNAISTLVHKDPDIADRMIARLSDLLRLTLENIGVQEVRLAQELEFLERYLEIERMRFPDRLQVRMHIAPETLDAWAPYLILQPIVENAIRHGIAPRSTPGTVEIRADCKNDRLILEVRDDGPGISPDRNLKDGVGISSTRALSRGSTERITNWNCVTPPRAD